MTMTSRGCQTRAGILAMTLEGLSGSAVGGPKITKVHEVQNEVTFFTDVFGIHQRSNEGRPVYFSNPMPIQGT